MRPVSPRSPALQSARIENRCTISDTADSRSATGTEGLNISPIPQTTNTNKVPSHNDAPRTCRGFTIPLRVPPSTLRRAKASAAKRRKKQRLRRDRHAAQSECLCERGVLGVSTLRQRLDHRDDAEDSAEKTDEPARAKTARKAFARGRSAAPSADERRTPKRKPRAPSIAKEERNPTISKTTSRHSKRLLLTIGLGSIHRAHALSSGACRVKLRQNAHQRRFRSDIDRGQAGQADGANFAVDCADLVGPSTLGRGQLARSGTPKIVSLSGVKECLARD